LCRDSNGLANQLPHAPWHRAMRSAHSIGLHCVMMPPALALWGIAMAQLGDLPRARQFRTALPRAGASLADYIADDPPLFPLLGDLPRPQVPHGEVEAEIEKHQLGAQRVIVRRRHHDVCAQRGLERACRRQRVGLDTLVQLQIDMPRLTCARV